MKRFLAVLAGFVLWSVLWLCYNVVLNKAGVLPAALTQLMADTKPLAALLIGSVVISLVSGYVTGAIAGTPETPAVLALGVVLLLTGIYFQSKVWHLMPLWYHVLFLVLLIPMCFAGARLRPPPAAI